MQQEQVRVAVGMLAVWPAVGGSAAVGESAAPAAVAADAGAVAQPSTPANGHCTKPGATRAWD